MEARLNSDHLKPGLLERAFAISLVAIGIGGAIALAAWGIASTWQPFLLNKLTLRIENPDLRISNPTLHVEPDVGGPKTVTPPQREIEIPGIPSTGTQTNRPTDDVIKREVTVFSTVTHGTGAVVTGWVYRDGAGRVPTRQYCYFSATNADLSSTKVDLASDRKRLPNVASDLVPDPEAAIAKCQWWNY